VSSICTGPADTPWTQSAGAFAGAATVVVPPSIGAQLGGDDAVPAQSKPPYTRAATLISTDSWKVAPHT
jgi:hypothetical protein